MISSINPARKSIGGARWIGMSIRCRSPEGCGRSRARKLAGGGHRRRGSPILAHDPVDEIGRRNDLRTPDRGQPAERQRAARGRAQSPGNCAPAETPIVMVFRPRPSSPRSKTWTIIEGSRPAFIGTTRRTARSNNSWSRRLASLLWRLRRATQIETGLFEVQSASVLQRQSDRVNHQALNPELKVFYQMLAIQSPPIERRHRKSSRRSMSRNPEVPSPQHQQQIDSAFVYLAHGPQQPRRA